MRERGAAGRDRADAAGIPAGSPSQARRPRRPIVDVYDRDGAIDPYDAVDEELPPPPRQKRRVGLMIATVTGELMITLGVILGLFVVYELWWTNITADHAVHQAENDLLNKWNAPATKSGPAPIPSFQPGEGFGFLYIPAFGPGWKTIIMQGTGIQQVLNKAAAGHYTDPASAMPWDPTGNFALAGHRDGHGKIFSNLDRLHEGDKIYVETQNTWFVYELDKELPSTSMHDIGAVAPIPKGGPYSKPGRYITLTTCTPHYIDTERLIWWGHMIGESPRLAGPPPGLVV